MKTAVKPFVIYKLYEGELDESEFNSFRSYNPLQKDYDLARECLNRLETSGLAEKIDKYDVEIAARLIGALGERVPREEGSKEPNSFWLLTQSHLIQTAIQIVVEQ